MHPATARPVAGPVPAMPMPMFVLVPVFVSGPTLMVVRMPVVMAMPVLMFVTMAMFVPVPVPATGAFPGTKLFAQALAHHELLYRRDRIDEVGGDDGDAALRHARGEAFAERSSDDEVHRIQRMWAVAMEVMHRHLLRQVETIDLDRFAALGDLVDEEPAGPARVWRDGLIILTGNSNLHRLLSLVVFAELQLSR